MSKQVIKPPCSISRATPIDSDCCRLPTGSILSNKADELPISFDGQTQVSQGHTPCRNKENCNTEVHVGGDLEFVKPAREPASSRPKPCSFLKNRRRNLARLPLAVGPRRKKTRPCSEVSFPLRNLPVRAFGSRAQGYSSPLTRR